MSIIMSNVKAITLGGQNVKKIEDTNGNVLWEEVSVVSLDYITIDLYKTKLPTGSTFVFGGMVIAVYTDGTNAEVTSSATFSGYDMSTAGTYTVTVSYTENGVTRTANYSLQVANTQTSTVKLTVGKSQDITTTQYYNRISVPSINSIKSAVAKKASISSSNVYSIDTVEIVLGSQPLAIKHGTEQRDTRIRFFLVLGSTISSPVLSRGDESYIVDFTSGNKANKPISRAFCPKWSGDAYIDITSELSASSKAIYGGYAMGTSSTQYDSKTPLKMFGTSSNTGVHMCGYDKSSLPTFSIRVSYTYFN